jgi:DNA/RNA endonuclease YhcR with UshA esterase domain
VLVLAAAGAAECIPMQQAGQHIGDSVCVAGKVLQVSEGPSGVTFLNFCADYRGCPFTVVVFPRDLRHVGDVRRLAGQEIQIRGTIKAYDGRPEIVLRESRQLRGPLRKLPPLPKDYDVQRRSRYSAGTWRHPSSPRRPAARPKGSAGGVPVEEPPDPGLAPE